MKKTLILLLSIILIAGCTGMTGYSVVNAFNNLPEVQEFMANNSNTNVFFSFLNSTEVNESISELTTLCDGNITLGDVYFARIINDDSEVNAWFNINYELLCVVEQEGVEEEIDETGLALEAELINNGACVKLTWTPYPLSNLKQYKVVKSNSDDDPKFPDNVAIATINSRLNNSLIHCPDKEGDSYFGVTMISVNNQTDIANSTVQTSYNYTNPVKVTFENKDFDLSGEFSNEGTCFDINWTAWPDTIMNYGIYRSTSLADLRNKMQGMMLSIYFNKDITIFKDCNLNESEIYYRIITTLPDNTTKMSNTFSLNAESIVGSGTKLEWRTYRACIDLNWTEWDGEVDHYALLKSIDNPLPTLNDTSIVPSNTTNTQLYSCDDIGHNTIYYRVAVVLPNGTIEYSNVAGPGVNAQS